MTEQTEIELLTEVDVRTGQLADDVAVLESRMDMMSALIQSQIRMLARSSMSLYDHVADLLARVEAAQQQISACIESRDIKAIPGTKPMLAR